MRRLQVQFQVWALLFSASAWRLSAVVSSHTYLRTGGSDYFQWIVEVQLDTDASRTHTAAQVVLNWPDVLDKINIVCDSATGWHLCDTSHGWREVASWGIIWRCCWSQGGSESHSYVFCTRGIPRFSCEGRLFLIWKQSLLWMAGRGVSPPVPAGPLKTKDGQEQWARHNVERSSAAAIARQACAPL